MDFAPHTILALASKQMCPHVLTVIPYYDFSGIQQDFGFNRVWNPLDE
jgi:hypothetical protein